MSDEPKGLKIADGQSVPLSAGLGFNEYDILTELEKSTRHLMAGDFGFKLGEPVF